MTVRSVRSWKGKKLKNDWFKKIEICFFKLQNSNADVKYDFFLPIKIHFLNFSIISVEIHGHALNNYFWMITKESLLHFSWLDFMIKDEIRTSQESIFTVFIFCFIHLMFWPRWSRDGKNLKNRHVGSQNLPNRTTFQTNFKPKI